MLVLLALYTIAFVVLMRTCYRDDAKKYYTLAKFVNSALFIWVATYGMLRSGDSEWYYSLLPGLMMCLVGDVVLGIGSSKKSNNWFLGGLGSFLIGHILLVWAFSKVQPISGCDFIVPAVMVLITWGLSCMKGMNVGKLLPYVLVYSFFVALTFAKSLNMVLSVGSVRNGLLCIGTLLFLISDAIILFLYFYKKKHYLVGFFNLLTYYYGMFLIALSVMY